MAKRIRITKNKELQKKMIQDFKDGYSILALADKYKAATSTVIKILKSELKDEYKKIINDKKRRKNIINIPKVSDKTVNESYKQSIFKYFNDSLYDLYIDTNMTFELSYLSFEVCCALSMIHVFILFLLGYNRDKTIW